MKEPSKRTKVVVRHLPPSLSRGDLLSQIDARFFCRYNWFAFRPGKSSHKHQQYARAYIDFKTPEDVFEFAEFFNGHVFVNEKGAQFKTIVEYAPSQRVPRPCPKKDVREGTIYKDPDYLEFLKLIAKPAENLPSAEIQLERKEAEQSGIAKESPIITPLMEFVRQKRAAEIGSQGLSDIGKGSRRARGASASKLNSRSAKRNTEKKKYVEKDSSKNMSRKAKSTYVAMSRQDDQQVTSGGKEILVNETGKIISAADGSLPGVTLTTDSGKKKILLLKPKDRDNPPNPRTLSEQHIETSSAGNLSVPTASRQNQRREAGGRLIRNILLKNEGQQNQSPPSVQKVQLLNSENSKRPPRPVNTRADDKFTGKEHHGSVNEKQERRVRNKDRPDRVVWAPRRSDGSNPSEERSSSSASQASKSVSDLGDVINGEVKDDLPQRTGELAASSSAHHSHSMENGSARHFGRRGLPQNRKDDGSVITSEGKSSRRGVSSSSSHEKQMWVQKSSLGS